jgi:uncharacterized membrane protein
MIRLDKHLIGIGFWIGGGVFSIINIIKNLTHANILRYDYIMTGIAVIFVILSLILLRKKKKGDNLDKKNKYTYGIGFWLGGGIYSLINIILNLNQISQSKILHYNYIITGVAIFGLILNLFLLKKGKQNKQ